jgi:hypothetical protein
VPASTINKNSTQQNATDRRPLIAGPPPDIWHNKTMWVMLYSTSLTEVKNKMQTGANFFRDRWPDWPIPSSTHAAYEKAESNTGRL